MVRLESVGTVLDNDGMTYPMLADGSYDVNAGEHLDDIPLDSDWMKNLSESDWGVVFRRRWTE